MAAGQRQPVTATECAFLADDVVGVGKDDPWVAVAAERLDDLVGAATDRRDEVDGVADVHLVDLVERPSVGRAVAGDADVALLAGERRGLVVAGAGVDSGGGGGPRDGDGGPSSVAFFVGVGQV